jgi:predicted TIM-barrel fold metal-dependent hydrolase
VSAPPVFDAHLHIADPRFPLTGGDGYVPDPFTVADYRRRTAALGIAGGAVVAAAFQGFDQTALLDALERLGPTFVGVAQLPTGVTDEQVQALDAAGVRGLRLNLFRGPVDDLDARIALARRVADIAGWHAELHLDSRRLPELAPRLAGLERLSIDHLGRSRAGLPALLALVERGARVKASGFGRGDLDVPEALRAIAAVDPGALMFGTDLPSTRSPRRPFHDGDAALVLEALGDELGRRALHDNAYAFYRCDVRASRSG